MRNKAKIPFSPLPYNIVLVLEVIVNALRREKEKEKKGTLGRKK